MEASGSRTSEDELSKINSGMKEKGWNSIRNVYTKGVRCCWKAAPVMRYLLREWRRTDERWVFLGVDTAPFFLASIIFKWHSITLIEHSIRGKPTFKTTLTKSSRKCSIELPSFNDRRQKSVCLNRIEKAKSDSIRTGIRGPTKPYTINIAEK